MARRKKTSTRGLGDDPLKWIKDEATPVTETSATPAPAVASPTESGRAENIVETLAAQPVAPATNTVASNEPIVLDAVITIAEAAALKDQLLPHINRTGEVCVDGSRVASVDTAGLQVLLAFVRTLQGHGTVVHWTGTSEALLNTAQLLGVSKQISLQT